MAADALSQKPSWARLSLALQRTFPAAQALTVSAACQPISLVLMLQQRQPAGSRDLCTSADSAGSPDASPADKALPGLSGDGKADAGQPVLLQGAILAAGAGFLAIFSAAADCEAVISLSGTSLVQALMQDAKSEHALLVTHLKQMMVSASCTAPRQV